VGGDALDFLTRTFIDIVATEITVRTALSVLLGWTLFGRVVLPRLLGLWLLAVSLLIGFAELVLGMRFGVRLLRLVRGRGG
jgi:hypothetical protein